MSDSSASPKNVPFPVTDKERIPVQRYYDEEFYRAGMRADLAACLADGLPARANPECRRLDRIFASSASPSSSCAPRIGLKAFHNACRHRGVQLAERARQLQRPRASSARSTAGAGTWRARTPSSYGRHMFSEQQLDKADLALAPCRRRDCGVGCAFINFDDDAPPLLRDASARSPTAGRAQYRQAARRMVVRSTVLPANWKIAMEAFMEGYHSMRTHPQLYAIAPTESNGAALHPSADQSATRPRLTAREMIDDMVRLIALLHEGMGGMVTQEEVAIAEDLQEMELPEEPFTALGAYFGRFNDAVTADGRKRGLPIFDLNQVAATHKFYGVEFIFPHFFVLPQFSAMAAYRIRPLGPESCLFEIWALSLHPENEERERPVAPVPIPCDDPSFPEIARQDFSNLPRQQRGLHAKNFEVMRLSKDVEGMISNYQRLVDGYLAGVDPAKLAKANQVVNSGLDSPILDIGF